MEQVAYEELAKALLSFIYFNGGKEFKVPPQDTYLPLAKYYEISNEDRIRKRPDGHSGKYWDNRIQWTRQRLINSGSLDGSERGVWRLTPKGVNEASAISQQFLSLKK